MEDAVVIAADTLDHSARAGVLVAAVLAGRSYQPGLLSRDTTNQAVITGVGAAAGYAWGAAGHSLLGSIARRFSGTPASRRALLAVDVTSAVLGIGAATALRWREHEPPRRSIARLAAGSLAAAGTAGVASLGLEKSLGSRYRPWETLVAAATTGVGSYLATRPWQAQVGAKGKDGKNFEDTTRSVAPLQATTIGVVVTGLTYALAHGEVALSRTFAHAAAVVLGGNPEEHRTFGRVGALATTYGLGWLGVSLVSAKLEKGGEGIEPGHAQPPTSPTVTGCPESGIPWAQLSREGRRWLSMAPSPESIDAVMGISGAKQPIRVYAALASATDEESRAAQLLAEIDRTGALQRKVFALFSPTGSGYVNYVACEALEYLTGGDCASAAIQYSVLPSALSLGKVSAGVHQTRMVLDGIMARIRDMAPADRPRFLLFGESLGSQVSQEVFRDTGLFGLEGVGIEAALWIGTPAATVWKKQLEGDRSIATPPPVGPGPVFITRAIMDWVNLSEDERDQVRYLLLQNGDDPIPKFDADVLWRRPAWLGPADRRPVGAPKGTSWTPVTTFFATFFDMGNALTPTPGVFAGGGHDYRIVLPDAISQVWRLPATATQMNRLKWTLQTRERAWEVRRRWTAAAQAPDPEEARRKVLADLTTWQGSPATEGDVTHLLAVGLDPIPGAELPALSSL